MQETHPLRSYQHTAILFYPSPAAVKKSGGGQSLAARAVHAHMNSLCATTG